MRAHWLSLPSKPLKRVDVFYLCPTEYTRAPGGPIVGPVDDPAMMKGAQAAFQRQATAFSTFANIYAPYYRQADSAARAALPPAQQVKIVAGGPTQDGIAAFDYFIRHFDHGRPFIPGRALAGLERAGEPSREVHESTPERCTER